MATATFTSVAAAKPSTVTTSFDGVFASLARFFTVEVKTGKTKETLESTWADGARFM